MTDDERQARYDEIMNEVEQAFYDGPVDAWKPRVVGVLVDHVVALEGRIADLEVLALREELH